MEYALSCLLLVVVLFALLGSGTWIAVALMGVGVVTMSLFSAAPIGKVMATTIWGQSNSWELAALPMFIWMGEILTRSRLSQDMFRGLVPWIGWLPGRLIHFNVIGSGVFAAASGSSAATTVTIGKMSMPELLRRGYDERISIGSLAGASTLGFLIPPSIILIVYGVATEQSIARLFIAGILPGLMLVGLFSGYVVVWALLNPEKMPQTGFRWSAVLRSRRVVAVFAVWSGVGAVVVWSVAEHVLGATRGLLFGGVAAVGLSLLVIAPMSKDRLVAGLRAFVRGTSFKVRESLRLIPILILIAGILGSIYQGIASPTDAAAVGVLFSLILSRLSGTLDLKTFWHSLMSATRIASMLAFMLAGASFLSVAMGFAGIPRDLAAWIGAQGLSPAMLLAALTVFYVVLGCFLDGISIVILSTAVVLPMIESAGIDTIWFGIYLVVVVEMSQITPPVGINLFILQALTGRDLLYVARAAMPFFFMLVAAVVLLTAFPEIALLLPNQMASRAGG